MAPKNPKVVSIASFRGLDLFNAPETVPPDVFVDALNVMVAPNGNAAALRSPANFNDALATTNKVLSGAYYDRLAGGLALFDINASSGTNVATYVCSGATNTLIRSTQADARFCSINVNNCLYRVNGSETVQVVTSLDVYAVGISKPAAAPTVSFAAGGSGSLTTGVTVSYAYRNGGTRHVGECSAVSSNTGASGANLNLRIAVVASSQTGVDGIVLFITQDGGSVRYLYTDANGNPVVHANTTGNIDISLALLTNLNFNVEETVFNAPPPTGATFLFPWKNRLMLCGFTGTTTRQQLVYSGFDQIFYGIPWETYPPLNIITIPNKQEALVGGVETPVGALTLSDRDAYLIVGSPTDKIDSGENVIQITEPLRQLAWGLGTRSPLTIKKTPFGVLFLDQNKHLQFWTYQGQPKEVCLGLRPDLETIQDTDSARAMAEATWFDSGERGGLYVLTASTSGSTNNRMWIVTVVETANGLFIGGAPSDIAAQCIFNAKFSGDDRCFIGVTDRLREILDFDTQGAGWDSTAQIYFDTVANNEFLFSTLFSIRYDGTNAEDVIVQVRNVDDSEIEALPARNVGGSISSLVNRYGTRQKLRFNFPNDDLAYREIDNLHLVSLPKRRIL